MCYLYFYFRDKIKFVEQVRNLIQFFQKSVKWIFEESTVFIELVEQKMGLFSYFQDKVVVDVESKFGYF